MITGRPTAYSQEMVDKAREYLASYKDKGDVVPLIEGLAIELGVSRETIYDWSSQEDKKEFSDIVTLIRSAKSRALQNGGLDKRFDGRITSLLLGHEGYRERTETTLSFEDEESKNKADNLIRQYLGDTGADKE